MGDTYTVKKSKRRPISTAHRRKARSVTVGEAPVEYTPVVKGTTLEADIMDQSITRLVEIDAVERPRKRLLPKARNVTEESYY
jgi:hypothetical protein